MKCDHETKQGYVRESIGGDQFREYYADHYRVTCVKCKEVLLTTSNDPGYRPRITAIEDATGNEYHLVFT